MGENNRGLHWMDVRGLSFNTMLLLEKVHFKWLPLCGVSKWGRRELGIAFRANPSVLWYAVNICPEVSKWINDLVNEVKDVELNNELVRNAEITVMEAINDWIVYVVNPDFYENRPFLKWDSNELLELADFNGKTVLDVGAGTGRLAFTVAPFARCVYVVEPVYNLREYMKKRAKDMGLTNVYIADGLIDDIPFESEFFDITMSGHVYGDDPENELNELERVTKKGGMVIFCPGNVDLGNEAHECLLKNNYSWSKFEEPGDGIKRKYWKTVC